MDLKKLEVKSDKRGSLVEAFRFPTDGQVFYVIANPKESRGNHYHLRKTETFLVIYGNAEVDVRDRTTGNIVTVRVNGSDPMLIKVTPNNTHRITATDEGAIFIVWADEVFDEKDPDTYLEEV